MDQHHDGLVGLGELIPELRRRISDFWQGLRSPFKGTPHAVTARPAEILRQKRTYSVATAVFVLWAATTYLADKLDPFGLSAAVAQYSQTILDRLAAPFYGSDAQDRIAVVLIDDDTMLARDTAWPPRYTYYEETIRRLLRHQPRAIFVDVVLQERRIYDDSLDVAHQALAEDMADSAVPVYFAQSAPGKPTLFGDIPGIRPVVAGWARTGGTYPLLVNPSISRGKADGEDGEDGCAPEQGAATVALTLYRHACLPGDTGCAEDAAHLTGPALCKPMVVQWGSAVPPVMAQRQLLPVESCDLVHPGPWQRLRSFLSSLAANFTAGLDEEAVERTRQRCPYSVTVKEEDLSDPRVAGLLKDRIVLVGTRLEGLHDMVPSPVHGMLPGVYLHAMALDNLMSWGRNYYTLTPDLPLILAGLAAVTALAVAFLLRLRPRRLDLWLRMLALGVVVAPSAFFYLILHHPPLDWLSLFLLFEMVMHLLHSHGHQESHAPDSPQHQGSTP